MKNISFSIPDMVGLHIHRCFQYSSFPSFKRWFFSFYILKVLPEILPYKCTWNHWPSPGNHHHWGNCLLYNHLCCFHIVFLHILDHIDTHSLQSCQNSLHAHMDLGNNHWCWFHMTFLSIHLGSHSHSHLLKRHQYIINVCKICTLPSSWQ